MKRFALLSVVSLMLASAVFAPVAMAQEEVGEVDVQSVSLGPGGSVIVTGTFQCFQDWNYSANINVRQRSGNGYNQVGFQIHGRCNGSEPIPFTVSGFSDKPFHGGKATVQTDSFLNDPVSGVFFSWQGPIEAFHLR